MGAPRNDKLIELLDSLQVKLRCCGSPRAAHIERYQPGGLEHRADGGENLAQLGDRHCAVAYSAGLSTYRLGNRKEILRQRRGGDARHRGAGSIGGIAPYGRYGFPRGAPRRFRAVGNGENQSGGAIGLLIGLGVVCRVDGLCALRRG